MSYIAYHIDKKTGAIYAYDAECRRNPVTGKPKTNQSYLGKVDPTTGEIIYSNKKKPRLRSVIDTVTTKSTDTDLEPNDSSVETICGGSAPKEREAGAGVPHYRGVETTTKVVGPYMLLDSIAESTGLIRLLKSTFKDSYLQILSVIYYIVHKGLALHRCASWSDKYLHPYLCHMSSQSISKLFLTIKEDDRQKFLSLWLKKINDKDKLCYDITSISSYSKSNEYVRYGYNRDNEKLPQINLAVIYGQQTGLPAYYRRMAGNISDVKTLNNTIKALNLLNITGLNFVLDRGFYSKDNISDLLKSKTKFIIATSTRYNWLEDIIDLYYDKIQFPENYYQVNDHEAIFAISHLYKWKDPNKRVYIHLFYQHDKEADNYQKFINKLLKIKNDFENNKEDKKIIKDYAKYLIINISKNGSRQISFNHDAIIRYRKRYAGFNCLLSNNIKDTIEALKIYRNRDIVENCFDDLKNSLDMKRIRVHTSTTMDTRLFIQFLSLILFSQIRNIANKHKIVKNLTVREILEDLESLVRISFEGRYKKLFSEIYPRQQAILEAFDLHWPS
jgi:transposase